jgi:hypothetical protein
MIHIMYGLPASGKTTLGSLNTSEDSVTQEITMKYDSVKD